VRQTEANDADGKHCFGGILIVAFENPMAAEKALLIPFSLDA